MQEPDCRSAQVPHRWLFFYIICLVYFFVYFHRVSTSVIVPDLLEAFQTNAAALGFMSSMYFYLYAFEQPLVGYLTDRLGPLRVIGFWSLIAFGGCVVFALAPNIGWASVGRGMIGIGVGGVYVPALKAIAQWFDQKQFTGLLGLLMSIGNLGGVIATTPLAWAAGRWGWRSTFFLISAVTLGLAVVVLIGIRFSQPDLSRASEADGLSKQPQPTSPKNSVLSLLRSGPFWAAASLFFFVYGTLITLQGLWATPFLMVALSVDRILASQLNMLIPIGVIVGAPLFGWLTSRFGLDKLNMLVLSLVLYCLSWFGLIVFFQPLGTPGVSVLNTTMGIAGGGFVTLLWGIVRETTPPEIFGAASGLLNPSPLLGVAALQVITGAILDKTGKVGALYTIAGFRRAFWLCLLFNLGCFALCFYLGKVRRKTSAS